MCVRKAGGIPMVNEGPDILEQQRHQLYIADIDHAFSESAKFLAQLMMMYGKTGGVNKPLFLNYKCMFNFLFFNTSCLREMQSYSELIKRVDRWLLSRSATVNDLVEGRMLFGEYARALETAGVHTLR